MEEIRNCSEYLEYEIQEVNLEYIITLGKSALSFFSLEMSPKSNNIYIYNKRILIALRHPIFALYTGMQEKYIYDFCCHIKRILRKIT